MLPRRVAVTGYVLPHAPNYNNIAAVTRSLRDRGLQIAVDDAGAGYASFRHIMSLAPDIIKLDWVSLNKTDTFNRSGKMKGVGYGGSIGVAKEVQCGVQG
jgi:predicted signal transduction protein with EAL and GGDEF domain